MRKVSGVISLLLALLIGVGCIGAFAQAPAEPEGDVIVQDNAVQETAEREVPEQAAKEETAEQAEGETAEPEAAAEETAEQAEGETAEPEAAAEETAEQAVQAVDVQETADQAASENEEKLNEAQAGIPSESEGTENTADETEAQPVAGILNEAEEQAAYDKNAEESFTANISIELTSAGDIHLGDELQLKAVVDGANRSCEVSWQNREQPASEEMDPDWTQVETGETYQLFLTEAAAELEYRVVLIADNGETVTSEAYRLPEPVRENEPAEKETDTGLAPVEKDQSETEEPKAERSEEVTAETGAQVDEEQLVVSVDTDPDRDEAEDSNLELAQQEIVVVTEVVPSAGTDADSAVENEGIPGTEDPDDGDSEIPQEADAEVADQAGTGLELPDESQNRPESPEKTETESSMPEKTRRVRILSSLGETIVFGETIRLTADLSDFEDCAEVEVIWETDRGSGWEEAGTGEEFTYTASEDTINWNVRSRVRYLP